MKWMRPILLIVAASLGAAGLQQLAPMAKAAMWQWSTTASSNATADPTINWSEGMAPSSVNDSARAMMAVLASWRNDLTAITSTAGTSTAYTLTSNQGGFVANATHNGFLIGFTAHATNAAGGVTINVDGAGAVPLRSRTGVALEAGVMIASSRYNATYDSTANEFLLVGRFASQFEVPLGALLPYTGSAVPNANFVFPTGQCISRTTFATYFAQVGTTFGTCDGVTTFGVPDLRGRSPWGLDNLGGSSSANRVTALGCALFTTMGNTCGSQQGFLTTSAQLPSHTHGVNDPGHTHGFVTTYVVGTATINNVSGGGASTLPLGAVNPAIATGFTGISIQSTGSSAGFPTMNPVMAVNFILRVL